MINNTVGNSNFRRTAGGSQGRHPQREIQTFFVLSVDNASVLLILISQKQENTTSVRFAIFTPTLKSHFIKHSGENDKSNVMLMRQLKSPPQQIHIMFPSRF